MGVSKNKFRLSRSLYARTTPYPKIGRFGKYAALAVISIIGIAAISTLGPGHEKNTPNEASESKQILGEQESTIEFLNYEVKKGDTLFNLSQKYKVSWETLAELNALEEPYILKIGQTVKIPLPN